MYSFIRRNTSVISFNSTGLGRIHLVVPKGQGKGYCKIDSPAELTLIRSQYFQKHFEKLKRSINVFESKEGESCACILPYFLCGINQYVLIY